MLRELAVLRPLALGLRGSFLRHCRRLYGFALACVNVYARARELAGIGRAIDPDRNLIEWIEMAGWSMSRRVRLTKQTATIDLQQQIRLVLPRDVAAMLVPEYIFHETRRWRFDWALPPLMIGIEIEGGLFTGWKGRKSLEDMARVGAKLRPADLKTIQSVAGGRHSQPASMREDMIKYNEAAILGWAVLRCVPEMIEDGRAITWIEAAVKARTDVSRR